jgi:hypothetical protein
MKVYAVMVETYNGEYDIEYVYCLYAKEEDAKDFVNLVMSGKRGPYSSNYWVEEMEVK